MREGVITLGASDGSGPIHVVAEDGARSGYEPAVGAALAEQLGLELRWQNLPWPELYSSLDEGRVDGLLYNQGVTAEREREADFTHPYGVFHESILVRDDSDISTAADLRDRKLAALSGTTNMKLAEAIDGAVIVSYPASAEGFEEMLEALRSGAVEALVDDEIFLRQFESRGFAIPFTVPTANPYAIAIRKGNQLCAALNAAIAELIRSGELQRIWKTNLPEAAYEAPARRPERSVDDLRELVAEGG